jgi:predicted naringenin-chalcone synthase
MRLAAGVPDAIRSCLRPWLEQWLGQHDLGIADVAGWAGHPGGPRILDAVGQCLDLPREALAASRDVLRRHGNMSSPTVLFVLERLAEEGCRGPCVMLAFGPGLIAEAALLVHE